MLSGYDNYPHDDLLATVDRAIMELTPHLGEFDSIAVRGVSGLIVGSPVALHLGKPLVVARKPSEIAHSSGVSNDRHAGKHYVILDDFVSTGATVNEITYTMSRYTDAIRIGIYEYANARGYTPAAGIHAAFNEWGVRVH